MASFARGSGPGPLTDDGCPVQLYRQLAATGEPEMISRLLPEGASVLDLGCGAGRIANPLAALGFSVTGVDSSAEMLDGLAGVEPIQCDIEALELNRTFDGVLMASYLLNIPAAEERTRLLAACRRHMHAGSLLFIQLRGESLLGDFEGRVVEQDGVKDVYEVWRRVHDVVTFTIRTEWQGQVWRQTATHQYLTAEKLGPELAEHSLVWADQLGLPEWSLCRLG